MLMRIIKKVEKFDNNSHILEGIKLKYENTET